MRIGKEGRWEMGETYDEGVYGKGFDRLHSGFGEETWIRVLTLVSARGVHKEWCRSANAPCEMIA